MDLRDTASANVLGIDFASLNLHQAVDRIESFITQRQCKQVAFANAHTVSVCWKDNALRSALDHSALVLADGMSIIWGGQIIGVHLPGRVTGPDLTLELCSRAALKGYRVFFLGSSEGNLMELNRSLHERWPTLQIVGTYSPPMCEKLSADENTKIFQAIRDAAPDILFVGMSMPKQEKWIAEQSNHIAAPVALGIGAAFDFLSGRVPRAPEYLQRMGLEWLYRLWCEPRRLWRRYLLGNAIFLTHLTWAWMRHQIRNRAE